MNETSRRSIYSTVRAEEEQLVLAYLQNAVAPGFTTRQVGEGTGIDDKHVKQILERLYVHRQVGRQAPLLSGSGVFWVPMPFVAPLELKGPPDYPARPPTLCATCRQETKGGRLCRSCSQINGAVWEELNEREIQVMLLIDWYGDRGLPFTKTQTFSDEATRAIQGLQRLGIAAVDLSSLVWRFGPKGHAVCADYKAHNP